MKLLKKILVATDYSPSADDAVAAAVSVARTFQSEAILLHVVPDVPDTAAAQEVLRRKCQERVDEIAGRMRSHGVPSVRGVVVSGVPFDQIIEHADREDVNVIVVAAGEKPAGDPYPLGMTAAQLCRRASKPVWVARRGAPPQVARVLCPVDFSSPARRAMTNAVHLARGFGAELTVLTVVPPRSSWLGTADAAAQEAHLAEHRGRFEQFVADFDLHGVACQTALRQGQPYQEILAAAREGAIDLIVMGSVGRTGLSRMLMGSVAEKVTREMPCSIVTVKAEHAIRLEVQTEIADIHAHFRLGQELLEKGFAAEAEREFRQCLSRDLMYAPAWEGLAAAYERLGRDHEAEDCRQQSNLIVQTLWDRQIEADIRSRVFLGRKK
jgi:universal stress protein E